MYKRSRLFARLIVQTNLFACKASVGASSKIAVVMAATSPENEMKRSASQADADDNSSKKQKIHHHLRHVQQLPDATEPAPQDPEFAEGQLLKSITAALTLAGFDSVKPTALEMFRAHTEECELSSHIVFYSSR